MFVGDLGPLSLTVVEVDATCQLESFSILRNVVSSDHRQRSVRSIMENPSFSHKQKVTLELFR